jgi:hypothetical protein
MISPFFVVFFWKLVLINNKRYEIKIKTYVFINLNLIKSLKNEEYMYPININRFITFTKKKSKEIRKSTKTNSINSLGLIQERMIWSTDTILRKTIYMLKRN